MDLSIPQSLAICLEMTSKTNSVFSLFNLFNFSGSPRKKRSKVTDSVRGPRSVRDTGNSLPASSRSSPQPNGYFPPTMVPHPHPLYNSTTFKADRSSQSPGNSDEFSDYGADGSFSQR